MSKCCRIPLICGTSITTLTLLISDCALRVTVAGDGEVQVHELGEIAFSGSAATAQNSRHTCIHRFLCHEDRVKRAVTEDSPHLFLTVAEVCALAALAWS